MDTAFPEISGWELDTVHCLPNTDPFSICNTAAQRICGDNTLIENIHGYIANYIGSDCIIESVDRIYTEGVSFGNG